MTTRRVGVLALVIVCLGTVAVAQEDQVPLANWVAPPHWTPTKSMVASAMTDLSNPVPFIPITPCRVADTRAGSGFTGSYGPPSLASAATRTMTITGQCGIPSYAAAVSFNFSVINMSMIGDLKVFPAGASVPPVATITWWSTTGLTSNAAIMPLSTGGAISMTNEGLSSVDVIIDVNGYYAANINSGRFYGIYGTIDHGGLIWAENYSTSGTPYTSGVRGEVPYGGAGSAGVLGEYFGSAAGYGVLGTSSSTASNAYATGGWLGATGTDSAGVYGKDNTGVANPSRNWGSVGVRGEGNSGVAGLTSTLGGVAVLGDYESSDGSVRSTGYLGYHTFGVEGYTNSATSWATGVIGYATANSGVRTFGVQGETFDTDILGSAGVFGYVSGQTLPNALSNYAAGVRGESSTRGVFGLTYTTGYGGVVGQYYTNQTDTSPTTWSSLGYSATYGLYTYGSTAASGTKSFVEPHPSEPTKVIRYIALEGNEAGTYFRGRSRFVGREAMIEVPDDFRIVTDADGLSIQVTPIGDFASVAVVSISLDEIVLKSTRDVEFFYTVNGLRKAYKELQPIVENESFYVPESADGKMPAGLSKEVQQRLISNGTYNADGTVNMDTAKRVGWVKRWDDRDLRMKVQAEAAAARRAAESAAIGRGPATQQP
jgi:hypothetical protein